MKCNLIFLLLTIVVCAEYVAGLKFINPIVYEVQEKFKLSWDELKTKCDTKGPSLFNEISNLRDQYDSKSVEIKDKILNTAKKSCNVTDEEWNQLIDKECLPNHDLTSLSQSAINSIQLCLDKHDQLNKIQTKTAKQALLERFCSLIKLWSKFDYMIEVSRHEKTT